MSMQNGWARLEPVARERTGEEGLQAGVADPLWLLTRQWQLGEFAGEDAGTPVWARLRGTVTGLTRLRPGPPPTGPGGAEGLRYDVGTVPLEALVESEPAVVGTEPGRELALRAGGYFLTLLAAERKTAGVTADSQAGYLAGLLATYPIPTEGLPAGERLLAARVPDGVALFAALDPALRPTGKERPMLPAQPPLAGASPLPIRAAALRFLAWYDGVTGRALPDLPTWSPQRLEYQVSLAAPAAAGAEEFVLTTDEYASGSLDWYAFDSVPGGSLGAVPSDPGGTVRPFLSAGIPTPVTFRGMPAARWWEFENAAVDFGSVRASGDSIATMLLVEYATVYSNDFFLFPVAMEVGSVCRVSSLVVHDTFGQRMLVPPTRSAARGAEFAIYEHSVHDPLSGGTRPLLLRDSTFTLLPTLDDSHDSAPVEEVWLLRDETANQVWAVEATAGGPDGRPVDRAERHAAGRAATGGTVTPSADPDLPLRYRLRTDTPGHWFPLDPSPQAAQMLDVGTVPPLDGSPAPVPWGRLLGELRQHRLHREEVTRAGTHLTRAWQYARWTDGRQHLWLGRRATVGRGGGASGRYHDVLWPGPVSAPGLPGPAAPGGPPAVPRPSGPGTPAPDVPARPPAEQS
ncbi:hypothetical protein [Micromonospora fluostatini]|uniref:hypothetical protein n=1 Tax=Micromonospora sp. JCM 30529 TaxID=3421643 RepID=UPI003D185808